MIKFKINLPKKRLKTGENWELFVSNLGYLAQKENLNPSLNPQSLQKIEPLQENQNQNFLQNKRTSRSHVSNVVNLAILAKTIGLKKKSSP